MPGRKAQIATEYIIITSLILIVATMVFAYSYVSNTQNVRVNQANNAVERITNTADLVYALGPGNSQFVEVTFPQGLELLQDLTLCQGAGGTYQDHYGEAEASCLVGDEVKAGAVEMQLSRLGGTTSIKSSSKAEIEMDVILPEETVQPTMGKHIIKVYWCGEKICISSTERAVSEECLNGLTQDCPLKTVECLANPATCTCTTALETCIGGVWPGCEKETYKDYNSSYELVESSCSDKIDNDCDGLVDCFDTACQSNPICMCDNGETSLCLLQDGVCAGSFETCTARQWPGCNSGSYGPDYENTETSCSDNFDNDCDGLKNCLDSDCVDDVACGYLEKTTIYIAQNTSNGQLGGRTEADAFCNDIANKPTNLPGTCTNAHIFLSITDSDEIKDMPINYGYNSENPVYWWHSTNGTYTMLATSWPDMFDGSILENLTTGTGDAGLGIWTGSTSDGSIHSDNCLGWTSKSNQQLGKTGSSSSTTEGWLASISQGCEKNNTYSNIPCITECTTELNCGNGEDDDGDGDPDCDDDDCWGLPACAICGNGILEGGEVCDSGQANECSAAVGNYWGSYKEDGSTCSNQYACNATCDNCIDETTCTGLPLAKTLVFIIDTTTGGDLASFGGGDPRLGADSFCSSNKPSSFPGSCGTIHAFLSTNLDDQIVDLQGEYGYNVNEPVYWWHYTELAYNQFASNWGDMLDGTISLAQREGTGVNETGWSGSNADGTVSTDKTCNGWSTSSGGVDGSSGSASAMISPWLYVGSSTCTGPYSVRCISRCQPETSCSDSINDNGDTTTDCGDPFCYGQTGPNGEACQPRGETTCNDGWDNDGDGQTDCEDIDCVEESYCTPMLLRTIIYMTDVSGIGVMTNRAGADNRCNVSAPSNLPSTCSNVHAFLSVDGTDEIRDMPTNYAYNSNMPVYWWNSSTERYSRIAKNWAKMFDEGIETSQITGTGDSTHSWSGSNSDGSVGSTCSAWTNSAGLATWANANASNGLWLDSGATSLCSSSTYKTRCMAECETENDCTNSLDDDSDGLTDCADMDCQSQTGPSGETCQPGGETLCSDTFDNDNDGQTDCDDSGCILLKECSPMLLKTVIYARVSFNGNFTGSPGRAGGDSKCVAYPATNLPAECGNMHAFLSVDAGDEIRDMPTNYGYNDITPVYWWNNDGEEYVMFATDWTDMLDGTILEDREFGADSSSGSDWSGSNSDGSLNADSCNNWTDATATYSGKTASKLNTNSWWLEGSSSSTCNAARTLRCATECQTENHCSNQLDDDSDGLTDCYDPDCEGKLDHTGKECSMLKTVIYISELAHNGDLASEGTDARTGADNWCINNKPANLSSVCTNIHGFISTAEADEITEFPRSYGYRYTKPIYWWRDLGQARGYYRLANSFTDMLDGSILVNQGTGTGISEYVWTGSDSFGQAKSTTCNGWIYGTVSFNGTRGSANATTDAWIDNVSVSCNLSYRIRCMAECPTEHYCSDLNDDDSDGLTDGDDPDCLGG